MDLLASTIISQFAKIVRFFAYILPEWNFPDLLYNVFYIAMFEAMSWNSIFPVRAIFQGVFLLLGIELTIRSLDVFFFIVGFLRGSDTSNPLRGNKDK